jgi:hypothetical protein
VPPVVNKFPKQEEVPARSDLTTLLADLKSSRDNLGRGDRDIGTQAAARCERVRQDNRSSEGAKEYSPARKRWVKSNIEDSPGGAKEAAGRNAPTEVFERVGDLFQRNDIL